MKRRLLFFLPSLLFIAMIGFIIAVNAPGDPVQTLMYDVTGTNSFSASLSEHEQENILRQRLGLNLPVFYFSMHAHAEPDTLYKVYPAGEKEMLLRLVREHGNWKAVSDYYLELKKIIPPSPNPNSSVSIIEFIDNYYNLLNLKNKNDLDLIPNRLKIITAIATIDSSLYLDGKTPPNIYSDLIKKWNVVSNSKPTWRNYFPSISFHAHNQFQRWLFGDDNYSKGIIRGDFGISYTNQQPVISALSLKIKWSLLLSLTSLIISLAIAIPLGKYAILNPASHVNKFISAFKNLAFATPVFWLATLLLIVFANPSMLKLFPASGVQPVNGFGDENFMHRMITSAWFLVLPVICYSYASIAFLAATLQSSLKETMKEEYIKTAFAMGFSLKQVVSKHAMRNVLLPLITLIANFFPAALGGSIIIENIFSIPGIGNEITYAVYTQNYPVIVAIVTITGFLTLTGYLLADIVYRLADPRIRYGNGN